ncbi:hypothetical protein CFC21_086148 [Triticum aestivum]|uniref:F-box associated beta-propeller type 3 domain-containing protein n=2 Tax=Triticum aestivum TaxID=4565 RepID=A0A3B6PF80_WHEAT|nr:hypothetical protein CFC21_086148 [Triticum aestivum]
MGEPAPAPPPESAPPEALLVRFTREPGRPDEATFFRVSSPSKPAAMPHRVTIPSGYSLSNVCNGLLCFARDSAEAPAFICNPITGETARVPKAPPPMGFTGGTIYHIFALGFSPSTTEHKLFRFTCSPFSSIHGKDIDLCVCTLDGAAGGGRWRQSSFRSQCPLLSTLLPVLVQGKLYLVTTGKTGPGERRNPDGLLEVDVATEARRTHRLPFEADQYHSAWDPLVNSCEMGGRLCLAVDILSGTETTARKIQFWVLMSSSPPAHHDQQLESDNLRWDLRYSFRVDGNYYFFQPRSVWFDDGEMTLCYRDYNVLFKHGTRGRSPEPSPDADCPQCDRQIKLPQMPSNCQWNIFAGYRPSLLSPLTLAPPASCWDGDEERQKFEHALLLALE